MAVIYIFINISFILNFWPAGTIKNETRKKFKNLLGINLIKYLSQFLANIKKHLGHTSTPTNVQNNYNKFFGFGVDITKLFLHWGITRNISCRGKFFNLKNLSQVFRTFLRYFFHYLCRLTSG